ncbi:hypothetical protein M0804_012213 [Polistes exclamans]|nr:hypothetical protein M0804_012213 [Polistes exclamans]
MTERREVGVQSRNGKQDLATTKIIWSFSSRIRESRGRREAAYRLARPPAASTIGPFQLTKPNFPTQTIETDDITMFSTIWFTFVKYYYNPSKRIGRSCPKGPTYPPTVLALTNVTVLDATYLRANQRKLGTSHYAVAAAAMAIVPNAITGGGV